MKAPGPMVTPIALIFSPSAWAVVGLIALLLFGKRLARLLGLPDWKGYVTTGRPGVDLALAILISLCIGFLMGRLTANWRDDSSNAEADNHPIETYPVIRVVDGQTLRLLYEGREELIRLLRIRTPEVGSRGSQEAHQALRNLVEGRDIHLEFETTGKREYDQNGRILAYAYVDGLNVNIEIVRFGWSPFWSGNGTGRLASAFEDAELEARGARRGIWATSE